MLLLGCLLLSSVLAVEEELWDLQVKVCTREGKVESLETQKDNEILTTNCSPVTVDQLRGVLHLRQMKIGGFKKDWYRLQSFPINTIIFKECEIGEITSEMLNDLPASLKEVDFSGNKIKHLKKGIIKNEHLMTLHLTFNYIREIESGALENMKLNGSLILTSNYLTNTKFVATLPPDLEELGLNSNDISEISPGSFSKFRKLRKLWLSQNRLSMIPQQALESLKNLEYLTLSENLIQKVEAHSFSKLVNLRKLTLGSNNITVIPQRAFEGLINLDLLDLSHDPIEKVEAGAFVFNSILNTIQYDGMEFSKSTDMNPILQRGSSGQFRLLKKLWEIPQR